MRCQEEKADSDQEEILETEGPEDSGIGKGLAQAADRLEEKADPAVFEADPVQALGQGQTIKALQALEDTEEDK